MDAVIVQKERERDGKRKRWRERERWRESMERRNATVENERMADVRGREMTRNQNSEPREKERRKSRNQEIKKSRKRREKLINRKENNNNKITKRNGRKGGGKGSNVQRCSVAVHVATLPGGVRWVGEGGEAGTSFSLQINRN